MRTLFATLGVVVLTTSFAACTMKKNSQQTTNSQTSSSASVASDDKWVWDGTVLKGKHTVMLTTSKGEITLELNADSSPKTATNFMALASSGFYDNLTFHRVIPGFMIQGGDPNGDGTGGSSIYGETFEDEISMAPALYKTGYKAGVIAMANRGPNTNGSQFFIMDADYPLPPNYTIFGHVTSGQDVVKAIATVPRDSNDHPNQDVTFTVTVVK